MVNLKEARERLEDLVPAWARGFKTAEKLKKKKNNIMLEPEVGAEIYREKSGRWRSGNIVVGEEPVLERLEEPVKLWNHPGLIIEAAAKLQIKLSRIRKSKCGSREAIGFWHTHPIQPLIGPGGSVFYKFMDTPNWRTECSTTNRHTLRKLSWEVLCTLRKMHNSILCHVAVIDDGELRDENIKFSI